MIAYGLLVLIASFLAALLNKRRLFTLLIWIASAFSLSGYLQVLLSGNTQVFELVLPALGTVTELVCTPLSAWFGLIFSLGFPLGALYAQGYMKAHPTAGERSHLFWLGMMFLSMHLVLLASNSLSFMLAWELMSLASFWAILYDRGSKESMAGALYYLISMQIGAMVLLCGFGVLFLQTDSFSLKGIEISFLAKWLLLIGFAFKAGFFPFYSWLPKAHPVAPSHLSGLMSGLMIKTGIFGIVWVMMNSSWQAVEIYILLGIALLTAFNGVIHALSEAQIKKALAYSSVENIGIIGIGLCFWQLGRILGNPTMASLALAGALLHCLFHSIFKPMLFYLSGNVLIACHSLKCDELGGLDKTLPHTAKLFLVGTASISALPLFCGFISEFVIFGSIMIGFGKHSLAQSISSTVAGAILALVSALALIAFSKLYGIVFSGEARSEKAANAVEPGSALLISPLILAVLSFLGGMLGWLPLMLLKKTLLTAGLDMDSLSALTSVMQTVSIILGMLLVIFVVLYLLKSRICCVTRRPTWGCGYAAPNTRMQYSSMAFMDPLSYFLKPFVLKKTKFSSPRGYFPQAIDYCEDLQDYLDTSLIRRASSVLERFLSLFSGIHNGHTNSYITWLLLALLLLTIRVLVVR